MLSERMVRINVNPTPHVATSLNFMANIGPG